jgi:5'-3' exoribonuclease 1
VPRFDSNCITPGTEFMDRLGKAFRSWIEFKMETDPFWKHGARVVFSGPDVPGEGEHKIMDYIR